MEKRSARAIKRRVRRLAASGPLQDIGVFVLPAAPCRRCRHEHQAPRGEQAVVAASGVEGWEAAAEAVPALPVREQSGIVNW